MCAETVPAWERKEVRMIYTIEEFSGAAYPRVVRMSFELPYLDWCRFEKSELFRPFDKISRGIANPRYPEWDDKGRRLIGSISVSEIFFMEEK